MFQKLKFWGSEHSVWVPPKDLWPVLAKEPQPSENHVLVQIDPEGPYRWIKPE